jgi:tetratricopeptide (TPR) repeat protein
VGSPWWPGIVNAVLLLGVLLAIAGCKAAKSPALDTGFSALAVRNYPTALAASDAYLQATPGGPQRAEALYLRGRALEERPSTNQAAAAADRQAARASYIAALKSDPTPALEPYIHCSLGNVAFFQDDYSTAFQQLVLAEPSLTPPSLRATARLRIGQSQQRLGSFAAADTTFSGLIRDFPGTPQADRARTLSGQRGFSVRVGVYSDQRRAQTLAADLNRRGFPARLTPDSRVPGRSILAVGPYATWQQASGVRQAVSPAFPDAIVQ